MIPPFKTSELDIFARAFDNALSRASRMRNIEEAKAILMKGMLEAAGRGVRDENVLAESALEALDLYEGSGVELPATPL